MTPPSALDINLAVNFALLLMLVAVAGAIVFTRSLLASILLMSVFSLLVAVWFVAMDAPDVAFTEAAVGAGASTLVLLGATLLARSEYEKRSWPNMVLPLIVVLGVGGILIYAATGLPDFGDPASPANGHVGRNYIQTTPRDIGIPNVVTAVLASYRGFDTLGETVVIFAGGIGVALMLGFGARSLAERDPVAPPSAAGDYHVVLRVAAKLLIPLIALYAFYVQFHGDLGAGGGFQAGMILSVAIILHALVFGVRATMAAVTPSFARGAAALGVLLYAGVGLVTLANGGVFLDYDNLFPPEIEAQIPAWILPTDNGAHHWGQHFGIMLIELGVLFTVAATMVSIFYSFAGRQMGEEAGR